MKGRNPNKAESKHMDRVSQLGCIVCRNQGRFYVPVRFITSKGKPKKDSHFKVLPLCFEHHRMGSDKEPISRHPYKARFVKAYGTEQELLEQVNKLLKEDNYYDDLPFGTQPGAAIKKILLVIDIGEAGCMK